MFVYGGDNHSERDETTNANLFCCDIDTVPSCFFSIFLISLTV